MLTMRGLLGRIALPLLLTTVATVAALTAAYLVTPAWAPAVAHALVIAAILAGAWLLARIALVTLDATLLAGRSDAPETEDARRLRTKVQVVRRLTIALIVLISAGGIMMTFEPVRAVGASMLAGAGLLSVVVGLAAQSVLGNVLAGIQLAFSEAIRVGDVVVVNDIRGTVEQITLTYVVVKAWDQRAIVVPCTHFTTLPFENWSKTGEDLLGTVEFDVDWRTSVPAVRTRFEAVLSEAEQWDGDVALLRVIDGTGGGKRLRAIVSARDAATLMQLRWHVLEELTEWIRQENPEWMPRQRIAVDPQP